MKVKVNERTENKCNWTESKIIICDWNIMTLMSRMLKIRFLTILRFKTWVFKII